MGRLLYGSGMRGKELVRLRIKDIDFDRGQIIIRDAKGQKDRATLFSKIVARRNAGHYRPTTQTL